MEIRKLLLPIDVNKCRPAVFDVVNRFARESQVTAILLHVVTLNVIAAENRVYEELSAEAVSYLEKLSLQYINPVVSTIRRIRIGKAPEEILSQADSDRPDLILMTADRKSLQNSPVLRRLRLSPASRSRTVSAVLKRAPCDVLVLPTTGDFDCKKVWGRPSDGSPRVISDVPSGRASYLPAR